MFNANPKPHIHWEVGSERLTEGMKDSTRSFEANVLQTKGSGTWAAVLNIAKVTAKDVEKKYTLVAQNELGSETYKVAISTSPAPPADITAGAIAGIVVAVLVILLVIFILIFARAFGKWCFAGSKPQRQAGESSDTESEDRGSADKSSVSKLTEEKQKKRFFEQTLDSIKRKNKDKVVDVEAVKSTTITMEKDVEPQIQKDHIQKDPLKTDGIVYAELDIVRSPGNVVRNEGEKTEYAEIIHQDGDEKQPRCF
ncbi:UNVERIFIED_CONTAM: hypothetical protein PYX00_002218 [Menopon gallinae]